MCDKTFVAVVVIFFLPEVCPVYLKVTTVFILLAAPFGFSVVRGRREAQRRGIGG